MDVLEEYYFGLDRTDSDQDFMSDSQRLPMVEVSFQGTKTKSHPYTPVVNFSLGVVSFGHRS